MYKTSVFLVCSAALALAACGGSEKKGNGGSGASGGVGTGILNGFGGGSGSGNLNGNLTGGVLDLTPDQATAIRDSACAGWAVSPEAQPAIIDMIVDTSGSMSADAPGGGGSKWVVTRDALGTAITALPDSSGVGVLFYPGLSNVSASTTPRDITACVDTGAMIGVDLLGTTHRQAIDSALQGASAAGGTPTHDAYRYGLTQGLLPSNLPGNKFMLLITDGQPTYSLNCVGDGLTIHPVDEQPIVDEIGNAFLLGVRTFVIGSPGSERNESTGADARPWLSKAARAGGTAPAGCTDTGPTFCHMDMTTAPDFGAALSAGLAQIAGQITSCDYPLPDPPNGQTIDAGALNVVFTDGTGQAHLILQSSASDCTEGWKLVNGNTVTLCGDSCTQVKADHAASLEVLGGCQTVVLTK